MTTKTDIVEVDGQMLFVLSGVAEGVIVKESDWLQQQVTFGRIEAAERGSKALLEYAATLRAGEHGGERGGH